MDGCSPAGVSTCWRTSARRWPTRLAATATFAWRNGRRWTLQLVAQKLLSAVIRTGERFGVAHVSDVLLGSGKQRIKELGHDQLSVYGIVKDYDRNELRDIANGLVEQGLLARADGQYATISVTDAGREWLRSRKGLMLEMRTDAVASEKGRRGKYQGRAVSLIDMAADYDGRLFDELRALRRRSG